MEWLKEFVGALGGDVERLVGILTACVSGAPTNASGAALAGEFAEIMRLPYYQWLSGANIAEVEDEQLLEVFPGAIRVVAPCPGGG